MLMVRIQNAAYFEPPMAAKPGKRFFIKTIRPALLMLSLIPTILMFYSQPYMKFNVLRGALAAAARVVGSTSPWMEVQLGSGSKVRAFRAEFLGASQFPFPEVTRIAS